MLAVQCPGRPYVGPCRPYVWPYVGLSWPYLAPMLALCWPRPALCSPMSALCRPYVGPSWPYLAPMLAHVGSLVPSGRQILPTYVKTPSTCQFFPFPGPPWTPKPRPRIEMLTKKWERGYAHGMHHTPFDLWVSLGCWGHIPRPDVAQRYVFGTSEPCATVCMHKTLIFCQDIESWLTKMLPDG